MTHLVFQKKWFFTENWPIHVKDFGFSRKKEEEKEVVYKGCPRKHLLSLWKADPYEVAHCCSVIVHKCRKCLCLCDEFISSYCMLNSHFYDPLAEWIMRQTISFIVSLHLLCMLTAFTLFIKGCHQNIKWLCSWRSQLPRALQSFFLFKIYR